MKKILITGATGFIGRRLVPLLLHDGCALRVLVRTPDKLDPRLRSELDVVQGSLASRSAITRATDGVDTVLHLAALAAAHDPDPTRFERDNTQAVARLLRVASTAQVRRFVHVSSIAALPPVPHPAAQLARHAPTPYAQSKMDAEKLVRGWSEGRMETVTVRPTRVFGPGPWNDANGTTRLIAMYLRGRLRMRPSDGDVQANYVYVDDVARGIWLAARRGHSGSAYQLGGQNISLRGFLETIAEVSGRRRRVWTVPPALLARAVHLGAVWSRCGGRVSLTPAWLEYFLEHRPADITASRQDLGYEPLNLKQGLNRTIPWLFESPGGEFHDRRRRIRRRQAWA